MVQQIRVQRRFTLSYEHGSYYVSIPNYKGGEVVPAEIADDLLEALDVLTDSYLTIPGMSGLPLPNAEAYHQALAAIRKARGESS